MVALPQPQPVVVAAAVVASPRAVATTGAERVFHPLALALALVPGTGLAGPVGDVRSFLAARQRAGRYLDRRGLQRLIIPWQLVRATARRGAGRS